MDLFSEVSGVRTTESSGFMERAMGIEPTSEAWEAIESNWLHAAANQPNLTGKRSVQFRPPAPFVPARDGSPKKSSLP